MLRHITMYDGAGLIPCLMKLTRREIIALCWGVMGLNGFRICNTSDFIIAFYWVNCLLKINVDISSRVCLVAFFSSRHQNKLSRGWDESVRKVCRILDHVHVESEIPQFFVTWRSFFFKLLGILFRWVLIVAEKASYFHLESFKKTCWMSKNEGRDN